MLRLTAVILLVLFLNLSVIASIANAGTNGEPFCEDFAGKFRAGQVTDNCASPSGICTSGIVTDTDLFDGTLSYTVSNISGDGMSYAGTIVVTTEEGTLTINDLGVLNRASGTFSGLSLDVSGTGDFAGATGEFFLSGKAIETNFDGWIRGRICFPKQLLSLPA